MKQKKWFAVLMAVVMLFSISVFPVTAQAASEQEPTIYVADMEDIAEIQPRLKYLSIVTTDIQPNAEYVHCYGTYTAFCQEKVTVYLTIQRSRDTSTWVEQQAWTDSFKPGRGVNTVSGNCHTTSPGMYYRTQVTVLVQDDNNKILEGVVLNSKIITR